MSSGSQVRIKLIGTEYTVTGYEDPAHLHEVAEYVNNRMQLLQQMQSNIPPHKNAVLTALNLADELLTVRKRLARYEEEAAEISRNIADRSRKLADLCSQA